MSVATPKAVPAWRNDLSKRWQALAPRERRWVAIAVAVVVVGAVWAIAVQPALRTLRDAPRQIAGLDARLQSMQAMSAEATALRGATPVSTAQSVAALNAATEGLGGKGRLAVQGDRATLTLTGADTAALQQWLQLARSAARARPVEAQLSRAGDGYSGTLVVMLAGAP